MTVAITALTERRYNLGGLFSVALSVGTPRGVAARVYPGLKSPGYAASRPVVFGLSSLPQMRESDSPPFQNQRENSRKVDG